MPEYSIHLFCDACGVPHPLGIGIQSKEELHPGQSLGDIYDGREMPSELATITGNMTNCPATGKMIRQRDHFEIFLVKTSH